MTGASRSETASSQGLKKPVASGLFWSATAQFVRQAVQLVTTACLARFLLPADFGVMSMALVIISSIAMLNDGGTAAALVQKNELDDSLLSSVFWFHLVTGALLTVLICSTAPMAAHFFREARVVPILQVLSFTFIISGSQILYQSLLYRHLRFRHLAYIDIAAVITGAMIGIGCAVSGLGIMSLAFQSLGTIAVTAVAQWSIRVWSPSARFIWRDLWRLSRYSMNLTISTLVYVITRNADIFLVGRFLGARDAGLYAMATRLSLYIPQTITFMFGKVLFPIYAQIQHDRVRLNGIFTTCMTAACLVITPAMALLAILADPLVPQVFGTAWQHSALLVVLLVPVGLTQSMTNMLGAVLKALGRTDIMARWHSACNIAVVAVLYVVVRNGLTGFAIGYLVSSLVLNSVYALICLKAVGIGPAGFLLRTLKPVAPVVPLVIGGLGIKLLLMGRMPAMFLLLLIAIPYGAACFWLWWRHFHTDLKDVLALVQSKLRSTT